jgi:DNA processing protein
LSLFHEIAINFVTGIGDITIRNLLNRFGSAEAVFQAKKKELLHIYGIGEATASAIIHHNSFERAEIELAFIEKYSIRVLSISHDNYPKRLRNCADAPSLLYFKGNTDLNAQRVISIVGARANTQYGKDQCTRLIEELIPYQPLIISGLAHGIDSIAHKESVKHNLATIGVVGHGLDRIYPAANRSLAGKMLECGGLLTEFPSGTNPDKENFPKRNRIIAGMSDATIVIEASIKGGALITAEIANSYNRDVFAYPGRIGDEYSQGCNHLIKTNRASLITGVKDLEYLLGWSMPEQNETKKQVSLRLDLDPDEQIVVSCLEKNGPLAIDDLAIQSALPQSKLAIAILNLEMQGILASLPGKVYKLI